MWNNQDCDLCNSIEVHFKNIIHAQSIVILIISITFFHQSTYDDLLYLHIWEMNYKFSCLFSQPILDWEDDKLLEWADGFEIPCIWLSIPLVDCAIIAGDMDEYIKDDGEGDEEGSTEAMSLLPQLEISQPQHWVKVRNRNRIGIAYWRQTNIIPFSNTEICTALGSFPSTLMSFIG